MSGDSNNPEEILGNYKRMLGECQALVSKISEVYYLISAYRYEIAFNVSFLLFILHR